MIPPSFDLSRYQALIFDMDGTLLDSSLAIRTVLSRWCAQHRLDVDEVMTLCHGSRLRDFLGQLLPHLDPHEEDDKLCAEEALETRGIVALPGARAVLDSLNAAGIPWGIATSSVEPVAKMRLTTAGLPIPEILVTAEQVQKGKPDPEHFVTAAARLGVTPERCLAFEDSPNGMQSALMAGCDLIIMGDYRPAIEFDQKQLVAKLRDYHSFLSHLNTRKNT
jgi:sugar-phosphatase